MSRVLHFDIPQRRWTSSEVLDRIFDIQADYARTDEGWGNLVHPDERQMMLDYFRDEVLESTNLLTVSTESSAMATAKFDGSTGLDD